MKHVKLIIEMIRRLHKSEWELRKQTNGFVISAE